MEVDADEDKLLGEVFALQSLLHSFIPQAFVEGLLGARHWPWAPSWLSSPCKGRTHRAQGLSLPRPGMHLPEEAMLSFLRNNSADKTSTGLGSSSHNHVICWLCSTLWIQRQQQTANRRLFPVLTVNSKGLGC